MNDIQHYFSFVKWTPAQIRKIATSAFEAKKREYEKVASQDITIATFESVIVALDICEMEYEKSMIPVDHLMYVSTSKNVRVCVQKIQEEFSKKNIELVQDSRLYYLVKHVYKKNKNTLKGENLKLLEDFYLIFKRMGFELDVKKQNRIKKIKAEIMKLEVEYQKNLDEWKETFSVSVNELSGLPESILNTLPVKKGLVDLSVEMSTYVNVMKYCESDKVRKQFSEKFLRVGGVKNVKYLNKIVTLRNELAKILGYKNFAEYSHELKMPQKSSKVLTFLKSLEKSLRQNALSEIRSLEKKVGQRMNYYNFPYYARLEKEKLFSINENEIKNYFELESVKKGCFKVIEDLFDVRFIKNDTCTLWHKNVELYEIHDSNGELVSLLTLDLYRRDGKYSHEAGVGAVHLTHQNQDGSRSIPTLCFLMNLSENKKEKVTLLTFRQVEVFFHEMGHVMHHSFQKNKYVSHYSSQPDFAELPSQWLEQYSKQFQVLSRFAFHWKTKEPLQKKVLDDLIRSSNFLMTHSYLSQVYYSLADVGFYIEEVKEVSSFFNSTLSKNGIMPYSKSIKVANFTHLASSYGANYYSYLWSLVYAVDIFETFKSKNLFDRKIAKLLRTKVFEPGSSRKEIDMIRDFLGREPSNEAFLKEIGI